MGDRRGKPSKGRKGSWCGLYPPSMALTPTVITRAWHWPPPTPTTDPYLPCTLGQAERRGGREGRPTLTDPHHPLIGPSLTEAPELARGPLLPVHQQPWDAAQPHLGPWRDMDYATWVFFTFCTPSSPCPILAPHILGP